MDALARLNTALADRYEITREVGRGGMATVYLARDLRHDRSVALKVLMPDLGAALGPERFLSEIRVTARLQHPNVLPLFDSGEADGVLFYTMPFVEGESLRDRLTRERQLPVDEAVRLAVQVAGALDYAHRRGVIHRDLKPENVLLHEGQPLVADFGIALAVAKAGGERLTQTQFSLGTPQYMSPEQAAGDRHLDGRSDLYALAAVTYEMLAGEPPHTGPTVQAVIARVLTETARDVRALRPNVPEHVAAALVRGLEKLPADRFADVRAFAEALEGRTAVARPLRVTRPATWRDRLRDPLTAALAGAATVAIAAVILAARRGEGEGSSAPVQFAFATGQDVTLSASRDLAIAPDGQSVVYVGHDARGNEQLQVRELRQLTPRPVAGTDDARVPFFSPDGAWLGFLANGKLMRIPVAGGTPVQVAAVPGVSHAAWSRRGIIVFSTGRALYRVPAAGGTPTPITRRDTARGELGQDNPIVLGDGETIVYTIIPAAGPNEARLAVTTVDGAPPVPLDVRAIAALGVLEGYLVAVLRDGAIVGVPIDVRRRAVTGLPVAVGGGVRIVGWRAMAALSANGTLAHGVANEASELVWVDESGGTEPLLADGRQYAVPRLSPDGKRLAVHISRQVLEPGDYYIYEFATATLARLTTDSTSYYGEWLPDSRTFAYSRERDSAIVRQPVDGSGPAAVVLAEKSKKYDYFAVSPDGRALVYTDHRKDPDSSRLMVRGLVGDTVPRRLTGYAGEEWGYRFSPDGRWLAYNSQESGREEVYVRPFPGPGARTQVSASGGVEPLWAPDGKRLFYRGYNDGRVVYAATISTASGFTVLDRKKLFEGNFDWDWDVADYDVSRDGKRLIMVRFPQRYQEVVVTTNWREELRQRLRMVR